MSQLSEVFSKKITSFPFQAFSSDNNEYFLIYTIIFLSNTLKDRQ